MTDEILDVVTDDDQVTNQENRQAVHLRGLQHRGVHVFLATAQGELIVQQRSRRRGLCPLALDCSVSEHVKAGEDYLQAAQRGLAEELGIRQTRLQALVKFRMDYAPNDREISVLYEGSADLAQVHFDPVEVERVACYPLLELDRMIETGEQVFSGWFVQLIHWYLGKPSSLQVLETHAARRKLLPTSRMG